METMLKSVAFHLFPFQLVIPIFFLIPSNVDLAEKHPGDEFWCGIPETKQAWRNTNACFGKS